MSVDFKKVIAETGIPTTEAGLKAAWEKEVEAQGAKVANTSSYSPFWRVMTALVTKPVLWLLDFLQLDCPAQLLCQNSGRRLVGHAGLGG